MSSLVFLGFSVVMFFISVGIYFWVAPIVLGAFFTTADAVMNSINMNQNWTDAYNDTETTLRWIVPLIPTVLIFVAVIKILMVASARGRD